MKTSLPPQPSPIEIGRRTVPRSVWTLVPESLLRAKRVFPLAREDGPGRGVLVVAMTNPSDLALVDEIAFAAGIRVRPVLATEADIMSAISRHLDGVREVTLLPGELPLPGAESRGAADWLVPLADWGPKRR